jgi:CHAT domain-containing protein
MSADFRKYAAEAFRQMEDDSAHPQMEDIAAFVRGRLSKERRADIEAHLAGCADCRSSASEFEQFLADCERPGAPLEDIEQEELDQEYTRLQRRVRPHKVVQMPPRWMAIAAAVIVSLGATAIVYRQLTPPIPQLLAQAYQEHRTSEFRLAGAGYAELRQERAGGSVFSQPTSLLTAQGRIKDELKSRERDPGLLRLKGEAQIIGTDAPGAVATLKDAHDLLPGDAGILADLGAAYALLGDVEHEYGDYKQALEYLDQSLRLVSGNLEVMFNRAVVLEKLLLYPDAAIAWEDYLKRDGSGEWANEARRRLAAIQQKLDQREKKLGEIRDDPAHFLKLADADSVDAEAWLISPVSMAWLARSTQDAAARRAATRLAGILTSKHGDTWLIDMTASACGSPVATSAVGKLMAADAQANAGQYEAALAEEKEIADSLAQSGCAAGLFQARLLQVAALESLGRFRECLAGAQQLGREIEPRTYIRLHIRAYREYGLCAMRSGLFDEADSAIRQALRLSRAAGYGAAELDLSNIGLDKTTYSGLPSQIVAGAAESLRIFWSGAYNRSLANLPLYELHLYSGRLGQNNAAVDFARAGVWAVGGEDAIGRIRMGAYLHLAVAEQELGNFQSAKADFEESESIATKLPARFRVVPATALARLDLKRGNAEAALARLEPLGEAASSLVWVNRAPYDTALGEALAGRGSIEGAILAFRKVIDRAAGYLATVKSEDERSGVLKGVESAYRSLVHAQLATSGNEAAALRTWQSFRNFDSPRDVSERPTRRNSGEIARTNGSSPAAGDPVLWYVELADSFAAWLSDGGAPAFHRFTASKSEVAGVVRRFLQESSDPRSSPERLRADARQIYRWMLEPFESRLVGAHGLVFDLDGVLTGLPLQSLVSADGRYLGDRFPIMISSGGLSAKPAGSPSDPGANAKVLLIANPAIAGASATRFPPLPDSLREAETIRRSFADSVLLEGRVASVESLARELPRVDIVHFAGHGYSNSGYGGLLLAPKDPAKADFQLLRAAEMRGMDWTRCSLAVLSACASAEGETHGAHDPDNLVRALARAGARRIAASLWNIDSAASAELMGQFYTSMKSGKTPPEALREAQQAIRLNPRWQQPYYWAGFQLYGTT